MKKAYMTPLAEVVKTETEAMICQSTDLSINVADTAFDEGELDILGQGDLGSVFDGLW